MYTLKTSLDTLHSYNTSYILDSISCIAHFGRGDSLGMKSHHKRSWDYLGGPRSKQTRRNLDYAECRGVDCSGDSKVLTELQIAIRSRLLF